MLLSVLSVDDELQTNRACGNETLKNSKQEKVLGVTIDNKLNFAMHLSNITKYANIEFNALTKYMTTDKKTYILFIYQIAVHLFPFNMDVLHKTIYW